ncbi:MAG: HAMP domain-containing protein [Candidatus Binataceae bacterium]|nr:HAMP domain-containing protein [Candidatus Binataceae bacterium]
MDLRAKLAIIFLLLLMLPFVLMSMIQVDRSMTVMVDDLADSGTLITNQAFEQIRQAIAQTPGDPEAAIRNDPAVAALLNSSQAFGKGVVYARIERLDGTPIVTAQSDATGAAIASTPPFDDLRVALGSWSPFAHIGALWGAHTYELSRVVNVNRRPLAVIRVGLSTALIAAAAHRSVEDILGVGAIAVLLSLVGAMLAARLLRKPLAAIATGVEQIAEGRDEVSLPADARDELGSLADKFTDLSRRIKASRAQWETERGQFINIFRSITDAVMLLDAGGAVLFANPEAQGRLGLPAGGLADGKPLALLLGRDNALARMIETAYATGSEVRDVALDLANRDEPNRLLISIFALGQGPEPPGLLVVARDLDSVRELENVVDYSGRLVRLGGLISGVAHQIRNPLNAMNLQLELLSQDAARGAPIDQRLRAVRLEIERLARAVDALMRFMRPEQLKLARVQINELITEVASQVVRSGVRVETRFDASVSPVNVDRALLAEALRNVIGNACEAMLPAGGTLKLATALSDNDCVEISIADSGPGIARENLERIFNLYFTTKKNGNGLGLPLALRAIDLHHGTMDIQSEVGVGTKVIVRLPLAPAIAAAPPLPAQSRSG